MALSVGFAPVAAYGTGTSTLSITPTHVGDVVLLVTIVNSLSISCTNLSSSNVTWDSSSSSTVTSDGVHTLQLWKGVATAASAATVTASWSGSITTLYTELCAFSIHSSTACSWSWVSGGGGTVLGFIRFFDDRSRVDRKST